MKKPKIQLLILPILSLFVILTSCCAPCGKSAPKIGTLEESSWRLVELNGKAIENSTITLTFNAEEKMVYGTAPCNNFFGSYKLFEAKGTERNIQFANIGATRKLCPDVDMSIEEDLARDLHSVKRAKLEDDNVIFVNPEEKSVAVFTKVQE